MISDFGSNSRRNLIQILMWTSSGIYQIYQQLVGVDLVCFLTRHANYLTTMMITWLQLLTYLLNTVNVYCPAGSKSVPYGREALTVALRQLNDQCSAQPLIRYLQSVQHIHSGLSFLKKLGSFNNILVFFRHCLDIKDFLAAAVVYETVGEWPQVNVIIQPSPEGKVNLLKKLIR